MAKIQIIEGFVDTISYEGEVEQISEQAKSFVVKIKESRPLNAKDLERYLLLLRDLPGLKIEVVLKPSTTQSQASDLIIIAKRKKYSSVIKINNEGNKYTGRYLANAIITVNSPFKKEDQLILHAVTSNKTRQLRHGHGIYNKFIGSEGTKLNFSWSWTKTRPEDRLKLLNIIGESKSFTIGMQYPFIRSRAKNLHGGLHLIIRNVNSNLLNNAIVTKDKLRIISGDLTLDNADRLHGVNLMHIAISHGIPTLGGTKNSATNKSRKTGQPNFTKLNLEVSRRQALNGQFSLYGIVEAQYSFNPLLSSERFTYGGSSKFRAYSNSPLSGDTGVKGKIELCYGDNSTSAFLNSYQIYGFYGYGTAWNKKITADECKRTSAPEIGIGARLSFLAEVSVNLGYDLPLRKKIGLNKNSAKIFFNMAKMF